VGSPVDLAFAQLTASFDLRLSPNDRRVLEAIAGWDGDISLDRLCRRLAISLAKPYVFLSVGRLEEFGVVPQGLVR
jgi:hypothetical protein